jgi:RNA polymerase-binding protein DksA
LTDLKTTARRGDQHRRQSQGKGDGMTTPLNPAQRAQLQAELERRRTQLRTQLAEHLRGQSRAERAADVAAQDADDAPQRQPEREVAMALTEHEQRELEAVSVALQRLQQETYGVCKDCGTDIPYERLKAEPWALRCIGCETEYERRSR